MKQTVTESQFVREFEEYGRGGEFSVEGRQKLYEFLRELEEDTGQEIELDVIAICCQFAEFETATEVVRELIGDEYEDNEDAKTALQNEHMCIFHDKGVIVDVES